MARPIPRVVDGVLRLGSGPREQLVTVESAEWWRWLDAEDTTSFRFDHDAKWFTARREPRRGAHYWYAYRKSNGRLHKSYLGKSDQLTLDRLVRCAAELLDRSRRAGRADRPAKRDSESDSVGVAGSPAGGHSSARRIGDPLVATKLRVPLPRPTLVARPRLVDRLEAGTRGRLTLVSAPAGFGKTTLLSEWARQRDRATAWVALDAGDNDPARFWGYVITAIHDLWPGVGAAAIAMLRSRQPLPIATILTTLVNELATVPTDFALVLDDYHTIADPAIHDSLTFFLEHLPSSAHVVIASRGDPPLPIPRFRARGDLVELRSHDLRFTSDEVATFLKRVTQRDLATDDVAALEARTEGWIAGLHLAALSMREGEDVGAIVAGLSGSHRYILDYLADEVLQRQPADVQAFLMRTSILDRLHGSLCDAVLGATSEATASQEMLERLERSNLFVVPLDAERRWYRYHHLFAEVLRDRLHRSESPAVPTLHLRAAEWYERHGLPEDAVAHALAAGDLDRAASLIEGLTRRMLTRGETATLQRWLASLPPALVRSRPQLGVARAWTLLMMGDPGEAEACLPEAVASIDGSSWSKSHSAGLTTGGSTAEDLRAEISVIRAITSAMRGDVARALVLARDVLQHLPDDGFLRGAATMGLALPYELSGDLETAANLYREAAALARDSGDAAIALLATCYAGEMRMMQGRLREAAARYRDAQNLAAAFGGQGLFGLGLVDLGMGELLREWNDLDAAEDHLRRGIDLCKQIGETMAIGGYVSLARVRQARGDVDGAFAALADAQRIAGSGSSATLGRLTVKAHEARLRLTQGDPSAAARWVAQLAAEEETAAQRADAAPFRPYPLNELGLFLEARVLIAEGSASSALQLLAPFLEPAEAIGHTRDVIEALILQSLAHEQQGNTGAALFALEQALARAEPEGYVRIFADEGEAMARLLLGLLGKRPRDRRLQSHRASPSYVRTLLTALGHPVAVAGRLSPDRGSPTLVEPLSDREIQVLRLVAAGLSNRAIADELVVAESTAKWHVQNILGKLGVRSRVQAVVRARALGLLRS